MKRPRILAIVQLPPPIGGATFMNSLVLSGKKINETFEILPLNLSLSTSIHDWGKFRIRKVFAFLYLNLKTIWWLLTRKIDLAYITPAPFGPAFLKDSIFSWWVRLSGTKVVFHLHGKGIARTMEKNAIVNWYYNLIYRNSYIIHLSQNLKHDLVHIKKIREIQVLPNGIPGFDPVAKSSHKSPVRLLYFSHFYPSKGALDLLKAISILLKKTENFELTMAGDWPDPEFKNELYDYYNSGDFHNKVKIHGPAYGEMKKKLFSDSDILIFPTSFPNECFPIVILEAMSSGMGIICSREGALPEILEDHISCLFIDPFRHDGIAQAILKLIENPYLLNSLSRNSRELFLNRYSVDHFEKSYIDSIHTILKTHG